MRRPTDVAKVPSQAKHSPGHEHNVRCLIEVLFESIDTAAQMLDQQPELLCATTEHRHETALHWLAVENHVEGVKFLLARGAKVNQAASAGDTPLMSAARLGHDEMCVLLIGAGANVNAADENEDTVLHHAAQSGQIGVIKLLIASGADPRSENTLSETPADLAPPHLLSEVIAALGGIPGHAV